jgi:signal transduction histidine kinase
LQEFFKDFGTKTSLLFGLICVISAGCAWALGRLLAEPIERLARSAKQISHNEAREPLPEPTGREVRKLTEAFEEMLRTLEDRQRFERFIADLSHDLKNPVAAIRASSEVLLSGAADDPEARVRFLGRIDEAGARLERLLSGLLSLARLEARGLKPDPTPWSLFEAMSAARRALAAVAEVKGVGVKLSFEGSEEMKENVRVEGSRQWVTRALENLIANAVKHSPRGGLVRVTLRAGQTHAYIEVEDEGKGVEESLKGVLFERYITHASEEGTGLGLAIVRRVAEAHGGEARLLESEPGQGARFELSLSKRPN